MNRQVLAVTEPHSQVWPEVAPGSEHAHPRGASPNSHIARCRDSPMPSEGLLGATALLGPVVR